MTSDEARKTGKIFRDQSGLMTEEGKTSKEMGDMESMVASIKSIDEKIALFKVHVLHFLIIIKLSVSIFIKLLFFRRHRHRDLAFLTQLPSGCCKIRTTLP